VLIDCQKILHYLQHINETWSNLLQHNKTMMKRVDQATVKALELTAPWASTLDAKVLHGKVLGRKIFCSFSQQEHEGIWARLQAIHDLIPSLFTFFEDFKYFDSCTDCLKWLVCIGPRDTVSTAMKQTYSSVNQVMNSALVQETEFTFFSVPAGLTDRKDLGYRQLRAFAMRYYREIPKKPSGKSLLAKPRAMVDTTKLREMADLADQLGFESPEIAALKQYSKSEESVMVTQNDRPLLVTDGPGEARQERCGMPHIQSYEEDRKYLFISHLHDDRDEQAEGITSFFRLRSVYLKFLGIREPVNTVRTTVNFDLQEHLVSVTENLLSSTPHSAQSTYSSQQNQMQEFEPMNNSREQHESHQREERTMQNDEKQRPSLQEQDTFTQERIMQEEQQQSLMSDATTLEKQEQEQEQQQQRLTFNASALREQEQEQGQLQQRLTFNASALREQEQEQGQLQQRLTSNANALREQEQEQGQLQQRLTSNASALREQEQEQGQLQQRLTSNANALREQEQEQGQLQQRLTSNASALREQEQEQRINSELLIDQKQDEREREELQRQSQEELANFDFPAFQEFKHIREYSDQGLGETQADIFSIESVKEHAIQVNYSTPVTVGQAQEDQVQENQAQKDQIQVNQAQANKTLGDQNQMNQGAKRQPEDENSDDNEVRRAHELQKGRKFVAEHKYQQLNKYPRSNNSASTDDFRFTGLGPQI